MEAVRSGLAGLVRVKYLDHSVPYPFEMSTSGTSAGQHLPYLVTATGTVGTVWFEDLVGFQNPGWEVPECDWDYNDRYWTVHVEEYVAGGHGPGDPPPPNNPPLAVDDSADAFSGIPLTIAVLGNDSDPDGDPITVVSVTGPANGEVSFSTTSVTYTAAADFVGQDEFTYTISDGLGGTDAATVTVDVEAPNTPPVALDDVATISEWGEVTIAALDNDYDLDLDPLSVTDAFGATAGTVTTDGSTVTYTPNPGAGGWYDTFSYTISDGRGGTDTAKAAVVIAGSPIGSGPCVLGGFAWDDLTPDGAMANYGYEPGTAGVAVALLGADGGWLADTTTDSQGMYAFSKLPYGSYSVRFTAPSGQLFTIQDAPGVPEDRDSDARQSTGETDPVALTPSAPGYGMLGAGFVPAPVYPPQVLLTYFDESLVTEAKGLKVAKWQDAFKVKADGKGVEIKGPTAGTNHDFIDRDPDRFNVWVWDRTAWEAEDANGLPAYDHKSVRISTKNKWFFGAYNDAATAVDLVRFTGTFEGKTGWYWSDSQMLVSNTVDDGNQNGLEGTGTYLGTDEIGPADGVNAIGPKNGYTWRLSDRTHKVALGGRVTAEYTGDVTVSASAPVRPQKIVRLHVNILRITSGGAAVVTVARVNVDIRQMREIYAQVGIYIPPVNLQEVDPPDNVELLNGLEEYPNPAGGLIAPTLEEKSLLGAANLRTPTVGGKDDIEVYYVNFLARGGMPGSAGESFPASWLAAGDAKYADSVIVNAAQGYTTLAHECTHILENRPPGVDPHYPYDARPPAILDKVNLMVPGWLASESDVVIDSRRITNDQQDRMSGTLPRLLSDP